MHSSTFDAAHVLHTLEHMLPAQNAMREFVHHNSLHAFQQYPFFEALFSASETFGFNTTLSLKEYRALYEAGRISTQALHDVLDQAHGSEHRESWMHKLCVQPYSMVRVARVGQSRKQWLDALAFDLDEAVHPRLFRFIAAYLDQGISQEPFPGREEGLWAALKALESQSSFSFFKTKKAAQLLQGEALTLEALLHELCQSPESYATYLYDQQFSHPGWSGLIATMAKQPSILLDARHISLEDLLQVELLLECDLLWHRGKAFPKFSALLTEAELFAPHSEQELYTVLQRWQEAFEWTYYHEVLAGLESTTSAQPVDQASFQALFCIDDRECSLRRHLETEDPHCETLGTPGFFGVEFYYQPIGSQELHKQCPAPVTPGFLIRETSGQRLRSKDLAHAPGNKSLLYNVAWTGLWGIRIGFRWIGDLFFPEHRAFRAAAGLHMSDQPELDILHVEGSPKIKGLQVGFTLEQMADRVEVVLKSTGLCQNFAPLIYIVAHGSSSANNPYVSAYDCGACSGKPGSINAKVFCFMANHPNVRALLAQRGLNLPESTQFVAALHDTASDEVLFYSTEELSTELQMAHQRHDLSFKKALNWNARERSRRFADQPLSSTADAYQAQVKARSASIFEPRPEYNHATNALCIIGERAHTKHLFLDRRAFLNSYNHTQDPDGTLLAGVLRPIGPVCGGINLEYYFSRVDPQRLGAGSKLPHNVVGLLGVTNSSDGDLRMGLPIQMVEIHDPVRLMLIVEHDPAVVHRVISAEPAMLEWYQNEWIHLMVYHPVEKRFYRFQNGRMEPFRPHAMKTPLMADRSSWFRQRSHSQSQSVIETTHEHLPVAHMAPELA